MGQDICIRKDEKPLGYDWECGHEELYVRVNMYYDGSCMSDYGKSKKNVRKNWNYSETLQLELWDS